MNFWQKLKKPIICLAPMADVTDRAFRRVIAKYGKPDVMWTEFVSADGLFMGGYDSLINDLAFGEEERPIVAQFFTSKPEMMRRAAELAVKLGFDGIDINMGCPDKSVEKQGAGAKLIKNPKLAKEIILAAKEGAGDLPVSVKTRIGWSRNELETWLPELLEAEPAVITVHARTRKELSLVPARWEHVKRAVEIRNELELVRRRGGSKTLIFGNGDVKDLRDAYLKAEQTGCDGIMIGRAIFGTPWFFSGREMDIQTKLSILVEHTKWFKKLCELKAPEGQGKNFAVMKKHFKAYVSGWSGAKDLRMKLMNANNAEEVEQIIFDYQKNGLK
jgi:nifR3 family TIM-barrel protein